MHCWWACALGSVGVGDGSVAVDLSSHNEKDRIAFARELEKEEWKIRVLVLVWSLLCFSAGAVLF